MRRLSSEHNVQDIVEEKEKQPTNILVFRIKLNQATSWNAFYFCFFPYFVKIVLYLLVTSNASQAASENVASVIWYGSAKDNNSNKCNPFVLRFYYTYPNHELFRRCFPCCCFLSYNFPIVFVQSAQ